ncbi:MAG: FAD-dependent oxidoreductase [Burkholderiaceae bacterium]|nr:FAD-dependent oxidoreductase [Burkholderiaceae bacterium]
MLRIGVVGGGIAGLAAAHFLSSAGAKVTLLEASDQLGGLGTFFEYGDTSLERFYHCMLPSDDHLLGLLRDIGLERETYWKETSFGFMRGTRLYPLNTPLDLLRFDVLPWRDRFRIGLTGLWGSMRSSKGLDDITCEAWLTRLSGRRAFDAFWKPMLQGKFGDRYGEVPALWFWTRFNREKGAKRERKGYIRGGYRRIASELAASVTARGGTVRLRAPVERFDLDGQGRPSLTIAGEVLESFDQVLYTAPVSLLGRMTAGGQLAAPVGRLDSTLDMQGVVNAVLMLRRGLTRHYWVAATDDDIPFQGVVESTTLLERSDTAGVHLVYLMNYVHRSEPLFAESDVAILDRYVAGLQRLFPDLKDDDIVDRFLFRSPFVEPLYTRGYQRRKPPMSLVPGRVFLATTSQVYPEVTSWNGSTGLVRQVVDQMLAQGRAVPKAG